MKRIRLASLFFLVACAQGALGARLELPLRIPLEQVRQALAVHLSAVYREGPCRSVSIETPALQSVDGKLQVTAPGAAALGLQVLGQCQNAAVWRGSMHFTLEPQLDASGRLRMRILDSRLADAGGSTPGLGLVWDLAKRQVHPRLQSFSFDVGGLRAALVGVVRSAAPPAERASMEQALAALQLLPPAGRDRGRSRSRSPSTYRMPGSPRRRPPRRSRRSPKPSSRPSSRRSSPGTRSSPTSSRSSPATAATSACVNAFSRCSSIAAID